MKTFLLVLIFSLSYFQAHSQTGSSFYITPPVNGRQLNSDSVKRAQESKYVIPRAHDITPRYYYAVGNIMIGYWVLSVSKKSEQSREALAHQLKSNGLYDMPDVSIKTYNGIMYVINKYTMQGIGRINFFSDYIDDQTIGCDIRFSPIDKQKAAEVLQSFLNGIYREK